MDVTGSDPRRCGQVAEVFSHIGDRWNLRVAIALRNGPVRFNAIRRSVGGVSQQMLTRTLKALERDGMVTRTVKPSVPPQVAYALTPLGESLVAEGLRLGAWAEGHLDAIDLNRRSFDDNQSGRRGDER